MESSININNIFKHRYLGKPYKTSDGRKAIYKYRFTDSRRTTYCLSIEGFDNDLEYTPNGQSLYSSNLDIVSEWQDEINEEELEEYAESVSESFWLDDMEMFDGNPLEKDIYYVCAKCYKAGIKTGYRKAKES